MQKYDAYMKMSLLQLRSLGKEKGVLSPTTYPKRELVLAILEKEGENIELDKLPSTPLRRGGRPKTKPDAPSPHRGQRGRPRKNALPSEGTAPASEPLVVRAKATWISPEEGKRIVQQAQSGQSIKDEPQAENNLAAWNEKERAVSETFSPKETIQAAEKTLQDKEGDLSFVQEENHKIAEKHEEIKPAITEFLKNGSPCPCKGVLDVVEEGYGFLRKGNYDPKPDDVYVSPAQIRRFSLKSGDEITGVCRPLREKERNSALMFIEKVNGENPEKAAERVPFDQLVPIFPDQKFRMECEGGRDDLAIRVIDLIAPIGKGQRGLIVSPPKAGKTTLLKKLAHSIVQNYPNVHLMVLLIDERPEEVTDIQESIQGEVIYSTFDQLPEHHTHVAEVTFDRAARLCEQKQDVVILLDSITRLSRAYNLVIPPTGRTLSGGLDPGALFKPKRFFGSARNIRNGGSLTVIATALVDTGSRMDDIVYEEFKGTGNMEIQLDRKLSEKRIFPAIDLYKSGTRRDDLLLTREELACASDIRRMLSSNNTTDATDQLLSLMAKTSTNEEFLIKMKSWTRLFESQGYSISSQGGR